MSSTAFHWIIIALLLAILFVTLFYGCKCRGDFEGFEEDEDTGVSDAKLSELTPKERELFQSLVENQLDDKQIEDMVKNDVITEKLVEKFLNVLASDSAIPKDVVTAAMDAAKDTQANKADKADKAPVPKIEAFSPGPKSSGAAAFAAPF